MAIGLCIRYAVSGTVTYGSCDLSASRCVYDVGRVGGSMEKGQTGTTGLRACYAVSGTGVAYTAMSSPDMV
eukprot:3448291-Rhodomonas_salina.6